MTICCKPQAGEYRRIFNRRSARRDLARYRRRGLSGTERDLVSLCGDVEGLNVLEVGGGIGALQLELLAAGASGATNVELSGAYEDAAAELLAGREVVRLIGDFVDTPVPEHDVVVLHRVVCCYPDADALVGAAASRTLRVLALTLPQQRRWIGWTVCVVNAWLAVSRCGFRAYQHPLDGVVRAAAVHGLRLERRTRRKLLWESVSFVR